MKEIVPPAEDESFQRSQPPSSGQSKPPTQVERYEVKRGDTLSGICVEYYGDAGLFRPCRKPMAETPDLFPVKPSASPRAALTSKRPQTPPHKPTTRTTETVRKNRTYTVQKGDMLERIARRELGDGRRANEIFEMNRDQLSSPDDIQPGMVLELPE